MTEQVLALITGVVLFATAVAGYLFKLNRGIREIHVMVNSRMQEALTRIDQLHNALVDAGVVVPDHPPRDLASKKD